MEETGSSVHKQTNRKENNSEETGEALLSKEKLNELLSFSGLLSQEAEGISVVSEWDEYFKKRYNLSIGKILEAASKWQNYISIPVTAFNRPSGGLESAVRFLREVHKLKFSEIAKLLNRDPRTVWTAYRKSKAKEPFYVPPRRTKYQIPVRTLSSRKHTVMESVCYVLKEHYHMRNHDIAKAIGRTDPYVWITLRRYYDKEGVMRTE